MSNRTLHYARQQGTRGGQFNWTPLDIKSATVVGFVDFEDNSKITVNAGGVAQIIATVGAGGTFVQATAGAQPRLQSSPLTGRQVALFDGVDDNLVCTPAPASWAMGGPQEWWVFGTQDSTDTATRAAFSIGSGAATDTLMLNKTGLSHVARFTAGNGSGSGFSQTPIGLPDAFGVIGLTGRYDGTNLTAYLNGGAAIPAALSSPLVTATTRSRIGANPNTAVGLPWHGGISAIVGISGNLSEAERNLMYVWGGMRIGNAVLPRWSPLDIGAPLVGFIDFEDNSKITVNAGGVAQIVGSVSASTFVQGTAAAQPRLQLSAITGRQVAQFDAVDDNLACVPVPPTWLIGGPQEMWVIGTQEATEGDGINRSVFQFGVGVAATQLSITRLSVGNAMRAGYANGTVGLNSTPPLAYQTATGRFVTRGRYDGASAFCSNNGAEGNPFALTGPIAANNTRVRIGASAATTPAGHWNGGVSAILMINGNLPPEHVNNLYVWAAMRLGLR